MTEIELLSWARGPGLQIATVIFVAGVVIRIFEILLLGRKANLAEAKGAEMSSGLKTMITRTIPDRTTFKRSSVTIVSGYIFPYRLIRRLFSFRTTYPVSERHHRLWLAVVADSR